MKNKKTSKPAVNLQNEVRSTFEPLFEKDEVKTFECTCGSLLRSYKSEATLWCAVCKSYRLESALSQVKA